jgi:hypothetical protein
MEYGDPISRSALERDPIYVPSGVPPRPLPAVAIARNKAIGPAFVTPRLPGLYGAWLPLPRLRPWRIASRGPLATISHPEAQRKIAACMAAIVAVN